MGFSLSEFGEKYRVEVIREWVNRLNTEVGEQYARRPKKELYGTVTEAFDADFQVLLHDDYRPIDRFIDKITRLRLDAGFLLSDVQKAFELFRTIVIPLLVRYCTHEELSEQVTKVNHCLAYTTHRFSDHFQKMHELKILDQNRRLEEEVKARTYELRESQLRYKTLVEEITDGYFVVRKEAIVFANQAFNQMHGFTPQEVIGKKFSLLVAPRDKEKVLAIYRRSLRRNTVPRMFEYLRLTKDGKSFPTEILAKNTYYDNKLSSIGICRDITQRVEMEQRVRESERMAYIGQITTSLSHEIRNPLSAVKMNLQILQNHPRLIGNDARRIDISVRQVMRLEHILNQLLDFAKPLHIESGPVDINGLVVSCEELLDMRLKEEKIEVISELDPAIPIIRADEERLSQALINLMLNAIEASPVKSRIWLKTRFLPDGGNPSTLITVEDEGEGISAKDRERIFMPFFTTKSKGTGLGLAIIRRIVEAHGGNVKVSSLPSGGASFAIGKISGFSATKGIFARRRPADPQVLLPYHRRVQSGPDIPGTAGEFQRGSLFPAAGGHHSGAPAEGAAHRYCRPSQSFSQEDQFGAWDPGFQASKRRDRATEDAQLEGECAGTGECARRSRDQGRWQCHPPGGNRKNSQRESFRPIHGKERLFPARSRKGAHPPHPFSMRLEPHPGRATAGNLSAYPQKQDPQVWNRPS